MSLIFKLGVVLIVCSVKLFAVLALISFGIDFVRWLWTSIAYATARKGSSDSQPLSPSDSPSLASFS